MQRQTSGQKQTAKSGTRNRSSWACQRTALVQTQRLVERRNSVPLWLHFLPMFEVGVATRDAANRCPKKARKNRKNLVPERRRREKPAETWPVTTPSAVLALPLRLGARSTQSDLSEEGKNKKATAEKDIRKRKTSRIWAAKSWDISTMAFGPDQIKYIMFIHATLSTMCTA